MKLYHRWKCPWCAAARQGVENVGVDGFRVDTILYVELIEVPYPREERDGVVAVSGLRRVPVLVDGDLVVVDSRRIVRHLYETYGGGAFARSAAELADDETETFDVCSLGAPAT